jgi:hypothetical protein
MKRYLLDYVTCIPPNLGSSFRSRFRSWQIISANSISSSRNRQIHFGGSFRKNAGKHSVSAHIAAAFLFGASGEARSSNPGGVCGGPAAAGPERTTLSVGRASRDAAGRHQSPWGRQLKSPPPGGLFSFPHGDENRREAATGAEHLPLGSTEGAARRPEMGTPQAWAQPERSEPIPVGTPKFGPHSCGPLLLL